MKKLLYIICYCLLFLGTIVAQGDDLRVYPSIDFHQTENSITIDPTDANNLIVACIGHTLTGTISTPYFYSHDGG